MTEEKHELLSDSQFFGDTIFCDDIRFELASKMSFIGIYNAVMYFPPGQEFPITLPKLGLYVRLYMPFKVNPDRIEFMFYFPGDSDETPTLKQAFENIPARQNQIANTDEAQMRGVFAVPFVFSPVVLASTGGIKVRAKIGDEIIRLGTLFIRTEETA
jgi:hypothetical protein